MKNHFFNITTLIVVLSSHLLAQKVDLDRYNFICGAMYVLPSEPLPEDFKTYNVKVSSGGTVGFSRNTIDDEINLGGWRRVGDREKAHLTFNLRIDNLIINKSDITERKEEKKDSKGVVTVKFFYCINYQYNLNAFFKVNDYTGKIYPLPLLLTTNPNGVFKTEEFPSNLAAMNYKKDNANALRDRFTNELVSKLTNDISRASTMRWGLSITSSNDHFWLMDSRKHQEQDSMQIMAKFMKSLFPIYRETMLTSEFEEMMQPFIVYLKNLPNKYKTDEKGDKKLRYSAYYNLAKLYWYLDNPDMSDKYASLLIRNDYDTNDGGGFIKDNARLRETFKKAKINKRHLNFDTSTFEGPK